MYNIGFGYRKILLAAVTGLSFGIAHGQVHADDPGMGAVGHAEEQGLDALDYFDALDREVTKEAEEFAHQEQMRFKDEEWDTLELLDELERKDRKAERKNKLRNNELYGEEEWNSQRRVNKLEKRTKKINDEQFVFKGYHITHLASRQNNKNARPRYSWKNVEFL